MEGFALYRLPHQQECHYIAGSTEEMASLGGLSLRRGFVVAPFSIDKDQPLVLIQGEVEGTFSADDSTAPEALPQAIQQMLARPSHRERQQERQYRQYYNIDFANFLSQIEAGNYQKLVLARCAEQAMPEGETPLGLFAKACQRYPRMMITLVYTPQSGLWLVATPEILLEREGDEWHTIALAGTMALRGEQLAFDNPSKDVAIRWATKDLQEQRYVATYITECLERFTRDFHEEGPYTVRAADLVHLRSDFTFRLADENLLDSLLRELHPTPAVCGLPKRSAFAFITHNEHTPRRYYSGFVGPLHLDSGTHLFVSLRCMQITESTCRLYAGGGLLRDSNEEQEWMETEAKMATMRNLIREK